MFDYVSGKIVELSPTRVVIDNAGLGYGFEISLQTFSTLDGKESAKVFVQRQLNQRDGIDVYYGFADKAERDIFRRITDVSGVGAATARMILSSMSADEFTEAVLSEDVRKIKSIKGIGAKSAQRLILELKDGFARGGAVSGVVSSEKSSAAVDEAVSALQMLGFSKQNIEKAISSVLKESPSLGVEDLIKMSLKIL